MVNERSFTMVVHDVLPVKECRDRCLANGCLEVSTPNPMAAFSADVVGWGDLNLPIGAPGAPERGELPGHPRRPGREANSLRASVRFVRGDLPLHRPTALRAETPPTEHGADRRPQLAKRPGFPFEPTVFGHDEERIGD